LEALGHDDAEDGAIVKREAAGVNPARSILQSYGSAALTVKRMGKARKDDGPSADVQQVRFLPDLITANNTSERARYNLDGCGQLSESV
jgi:hypothetical protein